MSRGESEAALQSCRSYIYPALKGGVPTDPSEGRRKDSSVQAPLQEPGTLHEALPCP